METSQAKTNPGPDLAAATTVAKMLSYGGQRLASTPWGNVTYNLL